MYLGTHLGNHIKLNLSLYWGRDCDQSDDDDDGDVYVDDGENVNDTKDNLTMVITILCNEGSFVIVIFMAF